MKLIVRESIERPKVLGQMKLYSVARSVLGSIAHGILSFRAKMYFAQLLEGCRELRSAGLILVVSRVWFKMIFHALRKE